MENNNGKGIFYGVIGVVTLVVAIIGATFAYFSASATPDTSTIHGSSNDAIATALSLTVTRVSFGQSATSGDNLVPADFGVAAASLTKTEIQKALTAKCIKNGYTGCHVWKIVANTTQAVASANIKLSLTATKANGNSSGTLTPWSYAVYTGSADTTITNLATVPSGFSAVGSFGAGLTDLDIHNGAALSSSQTYYVMVYIKNESTNQNTGSNDVRGSYSGTVSLQAAGGEVKTSFT